MTLRDPEGAVRHYGRLS